MTAELRRITYVEDDADIASMVQLCLSDIAGFDLQICSSGGEAVAKTAEFAPDLILMDMRLPDMDGLAAHQALKAIAGLEATPVIFMTARAGAEEAETYRQSGALGVIPKPFDPTTLAKEITQMWQAGRANRAA
jgi:CheY-like chemotaxis protein